MPEERHMRLGGYKFRLDPNAINFPYQVDYAVINTIGGQVIQVLGSTTGDLLVQVPFGQDHRGKRESWQIAEEFHAAMKRLMDLQATYPTGGKPWEPRPRQPFEFTYHDGIHDWTFKVLIKNVQDADDPNMSINHKTGKFSYGAVLTLFVVDDRSLLTKTVQDKFITQLANGMGWKPSGFNGIYNASDTMNMDAAIQFIQNNSTDGTIAGFFAKKLGLTDPGTSSSSSPSNPTSGGPPGTQPSGTVLQWINNAVIALENFGTPAADLEDTDAIGIIIHYESGGNPNAENGTDSNAAAGHPSKGLMQTIDSTFNAYAIPGHKDIWNPVDNICAGVRYAIARYGSVSNVPGVVSVRSGGGYVGY